MNKVGPLWRKPTVAAYLAISLPELDRRVRNGLFIKPIKLGPRTVAWVAADVEAWLSNFIQQQQVS